jgi:hypothetical protein
MQNRQPILAIVATVFLALGVVSLNARAQNPTPFIDSLSPVATAPGTGQNLQLTILGTGFASGATVNFNGTSLTPSSISSTQIVVTVPASSLAAALTGSVTVVNPNTAPLEGTSNVVFFPITIASASVSTLPQTAFGVGSQPGSVAVGDFNGDGKLDLAVANRGANTVSILLGDGTGNFKATASSPVAAGSIPWSVAVGDFYGDGNLDLAVADDGSNTVGILKGDGMGNFSPVTAASSFATATDGAPESVAVGDFNGDGYLDLAVANENVGTVTILLGDGQGNFTATASPPGAAGGSVSVAVGDFNGDGKLDLAVADFCVSTCSSPGTVTILLGDGTGNFTTASTSATGIYPQSVAVGDFNGDGYLDLAVANQCGSDPNCASPGTLTILLGDGTGNFTTVSSPATGNEPVSVAVGDFNGDGKLDLAVANANDNTVSILLGDGTGHFTTASSPATGAGPSSVAVGDFNGDGKLDLAAANVAGSTVSVLLQAVPEASVPSSLAFGNQNLGSSKTLPLTITNTGTAAVNITGTSLSGPNSADFTAALNTCSSPVSPAGNCSLNVTFTPSIAGVESATLTVTDNAGSSTQTVSLTGTGVGVPVAGVSPPSLSFGNQQQGTTSNPQAVTLSNTGTGALAISSISISGNFLISSNGCGSSLAQNSSCPIGITFTPQSTGALTGTLTITDNNNNVAGSTQAVSLSGTGLAAFTITPTPSTETVDRGVLGGFILTLKSLDGFKGNVALSCSGGPAGSYCADLPQTVNLNGTAYALSGILFPKNTTPGTYVITFTGTSGAITEDATATFIVK